MDYLLDFEKPISVLEGQIKELKEASKSPSLDLEEEIKALQTKVEMLLKEIYQNLSPWERVQLSRHPNRPHTLDYIENMTTDFHEIHGDRLFADDPSVIAGFAYLDQHKVAVVGIEKGRKTKDKVYRNFGMPKPEGYRKAMRLMKLADRFQIPIISFVDTPGAYPGIGAEERGQASAIAVNLADMFSINSPILSVVIGEGGSGGALGIAVADHVMMLEYSIYSVISPESCASILWADPKKAELAANSLQLTPEKANELQIIDEVIKEGLEGAHRKPHDSYQATKNSILKALSGLNKLSGEEIRNKRYEKFRNMGNQTLAGLETAVSKGK